MGYTEFIVTGCILETLSYERKFDDFLKSNHINKTRNLLHGLKLIAGFVLDEHIRQLETGQGFYLETDRMTRRALFVGADIREISSNSPRTQNFRGHNHEIKDRSRIFQYDFQDLHFLVHRYQQTLVK
jgi:hypothetical protein